MSESISGDRSQRVTFRPLARADIPMLLAWLSDPDVARWYEEGELSLENLTQRYEPCINGAEPARCFMIVIDGQPMGYIQTYVLDDHPDYAQQIDVVRGAVGTDLFIGDPAYRNQGWGAPVLRAFHRQIVFGEMQAPLAIIAPEPANSRAIRAYEKAGFRWLKTVHVIDERPENTGDEYVMTLMPEEFGG